MRVLAFACLVLSSVASAKSYVAIGDSITSGLNSGSPMYKHSWATGWGLERPFFKTLGADEHYNIAVPAATTDLLRFQGAFAAHVLPSYVSILAGTNDVCWTKPDDILENVERVVRSLAPYTAVQKIFVGSLPDLRQLYELNDGSAICQLPKIACHRYWMNTDEGRRRMDQDILAVNRNLAKLQVAYSKVVFVDLAALTYKQEDISQTDCFHPSAKGQQRIADMFSGAFHQE